ncbi:MAG: signal peptidase I [Acidimicrobiales bacterium]
MMMTAADIGEQVTSIEPQLPATERSSKLGLVLRRAVAALFVVAALVLAVVVVGPRFLPYEALIVRSGSMSPTIPTGSVVLYRREPASAVRVGQVIAFAEPGNASVVISHRVHAVVHGPTGPYFITKGDANAVPDAWRVPATGEGWIAFYHVPDLGYVLSALSSLWARLGLITLPALGLGALLIFEHRRPRRPRKEPASS